MLSAGQVAEKIGLGRKTVYVMKSNGKLPPPDGFCECEHRTPMWKEETIEKWDSERKHRGAS